MQSIPTLRKGPAQCLIIPHPPHQTEPDIRKTRRPSPRNRGCRHRRGSDRHEPCRGIGRELPKRIIWTSSCSGRNQLHRGRGTARHRRAQGQAPARSRSPVRFHACRGKGLRWPYLGRARISGGHEGLDHVLRGQLRRREDPCDRPAAYRPDHRLHAGQDQQPWHRRPTWSRSWNC